ncbi:MAG TPA: type II toxin-antitoxin system VapC family toxin [Rhizomicrobium sp.]
MAYLIDTSIAIHLRDGDERVLRKFDENSGVIFLSALSVAELQRGLYKKEEFTAIRQFRLDAISRHIEILPFGKVAAEAYGRIIALCGWVKGRDFDRMIAAHAIAVNATLVTDNEGDFKDIPDLMIENWL